MNLVFEEGFELLFFHGLALSSAARRQYAAPWSPRPQQVELYTRRERWRGNSFSLCFFPQARRTDQNNARHAVASHTLDVPALGDGAFGRRKLRIAKPAVALMGRANRPQCFRYVHKIPLNTQRGCPGNSGQPPSGLHTHYLRLLFGRQGCLGNFLLTSIRWSSRSSCSGSRRRCGP